MATKVIMPKQGLQMTEGTILAWLVSEGSPVKKGQPLFEIETDKVTITIDSPADGTLLKVIGQKGQTIPVAETIAIIGEPGERIEDLVRAGHTADAPPVRAVETVAESGRQSARRGGMKSVTPRAKMRAIERGIDAEGLKGSARTALSSSATCLHRRPSRATLAFPARRQEVRQVPHLSPDA